jgi:hypothetical protein
VALAKIKLCVNGASVAVMTSAQRGKRDGASAVVQVKGLGWAAMDTDVMSRAERDQEERSMERNKLQTKRRYM